MPTTRSQKRGLKLDDSIVLAKRQRRAPLRKKNINNDSFSSDCNNGVAFGSDDEGNEVATSAVLAVDHANRDFEEYSSVAGSLEEESAFEIAESPEEEVPVQSISNISLEMEEVGGQLNMDYHEESEDDDDEEQAVTDKVRKPRGQNKIYVLVESFDTKEEFDVYWAEHKFDEIYFHYSERTSEVGYEDVFRCKNYSKSGYVKCPMQAKTVFPGRDETVFLYLTSDEHSH